MITVYKIGGNVINNPEELKKFLKVFSTIPGKKILVHGGGKEATELSKKTGLETKMIDGRRVTDRETLDLVTMVYAGLINKRIVALLQESGCNAVGLTGADGYSIPATRRNPKPVDFGYVGDINPADINVGFISMLVDKGYTPVFCAICGNKDGELLNCNADTVASALAIACSGKETTDLTYCFEKPGVLSNVEDDNSVIPLITSDDYEQMVASSMISGGMIPKVSNALKAIGEGVNRVRICDSKDLPGGSGTFICNKS